MIPAPAPRDARLHAGLLGAALLLGALALLVDSSKHSEEDFKNRVSAVRLAEWLRARRPGLQVVDLRSEAAYTEYHLPQAKRFTVEEFLASLGRADPPWTVVVYGPSDGLAAVTAGEARKAGYDQVHFLTDGIGEWLAEVLRPTLDTSGTQDQRAEAERIAALSRYFGGSPRLAGPGTPDSATELAPPRGGCGF